MWQFWIDVGGTFTDCLGLSPDGQEIHTKVLSSGLFKGSIDDRTADSFSSSFLVRSGGVNFWESATLRLIDLEGEIIGESCVRKFDDNSGRIWIDPHHQSTLSSAVNFELDLNVHAPILAVRKILQLPVMQPLPACRIHLGSTKGTNALLTRSGARTAFVTTKGFRDLLTIGDQARPHLFELSIKKPEPLFDWSIEIEERILADGVIELSPAEDLVRTQLEQLRQNGIESIAICLMHGYRYPSHEKIVGEIAREIGFRDVRLSSEVAPLIKIVPRAETTVLDAYLNPVIGEYLDEIESQLSEGSQLRLMSSTGGLISRDRFSGKDSVLSGPAGGVVGAARIAEQAGFDRMIGFDMGGTSSDVSRYDGEFEREFETQKAGVRIVMPMMAVETVAAGGGSVCRFDGTKLVVGPESAGADPGPACYGRGGPLAITDINLTLGRIRPSHFPFPLNESAAIQRLEAIAKELEASTGKKYSAIELAEGFFKIANHNMAAAIRSVSVAKGYDPRDYVLVSFGGAGSQHCCSVARNLGMTRILDHPQGSILSAVGIRLADQTSHAVSSVLREFADDSPEFLEPIFESLVSKTVANLISEGCSPESITSGDDLRVISPFPSPASPLPSRQWTVHFWLCPRPFSSQTPPSRVSFLIPRRPPFLLQFELRRYVK